MPPLLVVPLLPPLLITLLQVTPSFSHLAIACKKEGSRETRLDLLITIACKKEGSRETRLDLLIAIACKNEGSFVAVRMLTQIALHATPTKSMRGSRTTTS